MTKEELRKVLEAYVEEKRGRGFILLDEDGTQTDVNGIKLGIFLSLILDTCIDVCTDKDSSKLFQAYLAIQRWLYRAIVTKEADREEE